MLAFRLSIFSPKKPYNITLTLATILLLIYSEKKVLDWGSMIEELVHKLAPIPNAANPLTLDISYFTCTYTETYSLTNRKSN